MLHSVIIGTGSYIPEVEISNASFIDHLFLEKENVAIQNSNSNVIEKFEQITGIAQRRYARPDQQTSDLGYLAAKQAIESAAIDKETLDYIIVAHNFGDVSFDRNRSSMVPSLSSRVKALLQIQNPDCVAYDLPFGCPGWLEGMIQADIFIRAGVAKRILVIGAETLSRVIDPHDRDCMIFSDGGGAVILEASENGTGTIAHKTQTYAVDHILDLQMGNSLSTLNGDDNLYIKMNGRRVYEFALTNVPLVVKSVLDKAGVDISEIKKVLIHQANDKMDAAILARLFKLYDQPVPENIMPMTIQWLGNSSVATIPTLLDLVLTEKLEGHQINKGDKVIFASVGAGMNINALLYQF